MANWRFFTLFNLLVPLLWVACAATDEPCNPAATNCVTYSSGAQTESTPGGVGATTSASGSVNNTTTAGTTTAGITSTTGGTGGSVTTTAGNGSTTGAGGTTTTTGGRTITSLFVIDNFNNPNAFASHLNSESPPNIQSDNGTMTMYALDSNTQRMDLDCNSTTCYWYSLLAMQGSCLNITGFTHIALDVRGPPGADASFQLQQNDSTCTSAMFTASQSVRLSSYVTFDSTLHTVYIPLTAFSAVDQVHTRAISILNLVPNVTIHVGNIELVTIQ